MKILWLTPTVLVLASNPVTALLLIAGFVVSALLVEWALGWNRR